MKPMFDLTGKVAFVAGVADSTGYGWAICKALAEAGVRSQLQCKQLYHDREEVTVHVRLLE